MKRVLLILTTLLAFALFSCNQQQEKSTAEKDGQEKENMDTDMDTMASDKSYTLETLNDSVASPRMKMTTKVDEVDVSVDFGSPSVKGRAVWGELVKYDKTWRTGANEATIIELSQDVMVNGEGPLAAGKYALFTVPTKEGAWKVVFNSQYDQWGAYDKDDTKDVLTVEATPEMTEEMTESLVFVAEDDAIIMKWEKLMLPISISPA